MTTTRHETEGIIITDVYSDTPVVTNAGDALDIMMTIRYETPCDRIIFNKEALGEDFFVLSTGLAGEVLQKFVNYRCKFAVYGDFSGYTSKPLRDFIYESNKGSNVFFTATLEEARQRLASAK